MLKLKPYLVEKIWGGNRIAKMKGLTDSRKLGESWEVSTLEGQSSETNNGPLSELIKLPYLVKFIDTTDNLSVQVHPGDEYAKKHENSLGKSECWYILDAAHGAGVYLGLKEGITLKELEKTVRESGAIDQLMNFYPVKKGDFIYVPAGTIHAIGKGVFLIEAQQASGITYRFWDWNRLDEQGNSRELHVEKALAVIDPKTKYLVKDSLGEFSFKNLSVKLVSHESLIAPGSITIIEGICNGHETGNSFYTDRQLKFSSDKFQGIWVGEN